MAEELKLVSKTDATKIRNLALKIVNRELTPEGSPVEGSLMWKPSSGEQQPCCARAMRKLSRFNPLVVYNHCLTLEHVSKKHGISYRALKYEVRRVRALVDQLTTVHA